MCIDKRLDFLREMSLLRGRISKNINSYSWHAYLRTFRKSRYVDFDPDGEDILTIKRPEQKAGCKNDRITTELYNRLHRYFGDKERPSNRQILYIGNGILKSTDKGEESLEHPFFVRALEVDFDPVEEKLMMRYSEEGTNVCTNVLPAELSNEKLSLKIINNVEAEGISPVGKAGLELIRKTINIMTPEGGTADIYDGDRPVKHRFCMDNDPVIFISERKNFYEEYISRLRRKLDDGDLELSRAFCRLMDIDCDEEEEKEGEGDDLTAIYPLNDAQKKIVRNADSRPVSVITGPPGTGKTYSLLAVAADQAQRGHSVLVTAENDTALQALVDLMPDDIKGITAFLDGRNSHDKILRTIRNIQDYREKVDSGTLDIEGEISRLDEIIESSGAKKKTATERLSRSVTTIEADGETLDAAEAGRFLLEHYHEIEEVLGDSTADHSFRMKDLMQLYSTNSLSAKELALIESGLLDSLPDADALRREARESGTRLSGKLSRAIGYLNIFNSYQWLRAAALEGENGRYHTFLKAGKRYLTMRRDMEDLHGDDVVEIDPDTDQEDIRREFPHIHEAYLEKGCLTLRQKLDRSLMDVYRSILVNGRFIDSEEDCDAVKMYVEMEVSRTLMESLYEELFGTPFEKNGQDHAAIYEETRILLEMAFTYDSRMEEMRDLFYMCDRNWEDRMDIHYYDTRRVKLDKLAGKLDIVAELLDAALATEKANGMESALETAHRQISELAAFDSPAAEILSKDLSSGRDGYEQYDKDLEQLHERYATVEDTAAVRRNLLSRLDHASAPRLYESFGSGLHAAAAPPEEVTNALKARFVLDAFREAASDEYERYAEEIRDASAAIRRCRQKKVFYTILGNILKSIEEDEDCRKGMNALMLSIGALGRGKGSSKTVKEIRQGISDAISKLAGSIPIWIMPVHMVYKTIAPGTFDMLLYDEASESTVVETLILTAARSAVICGDGEQSEAFVVGVKDDHLRSLRERFLDEIDYSYLYNFKMSLYDLSKIKCDDQSVMLTEHYRSHPYLISLSNELSYGGDLRSMRDPVQALPPVVDVPVKGMKKGRTNLIEAEEALKIIRKILDDPAYDGMSIGVASLVGKDQAERIERLVMKELPPDTIKTRDMIFGNMGDLQGSERDVMIISCVESPEHEDDVLPLRHRDANDGIYRRNINVCFSRARFENIVIRSFDQGNLKAGDVRQTIVSYCTEARDIIRADRGTLTGFEEDVADYVERAGVTVCRNVEIGGCTVPLFCHSGTEGSFILSCRDGDDACTAPLERAGYRIRKVHIPDFYLYAAVN